MGGEQSKKEGGEEGEQFHGRAECRDLIIEGVKFSVYPL